MSLIFLTLQLDPMQRKSWEGTAKDCIPASPNWIKKNRYVQGITHPFLFQTSFQSCPLQRVMDFIEELICPVVLWCKYLPLDGLIRVYYFFFLNTCYFCLNRAVSKHQCRHLRFWQSFIYHTTVQILLCEKECIQLTDNAIPFLSFKDVKYF